MTVLAIAHALPNATAEAFQRIRPEEIRTVWNIYRRGQIGQIYYCTDREVAVLMLNCTTIDEAGSILAELPMVRERLIDWDYYPIGPFTPWDGLLGAAAATSTP
jgi:hypothetical protein